MDGKGKGLIPVDLVQCLLPSGTNVADPHVVIDYQNAVYQRIVGVESLPNCEDLLLKWHKEGRLKLQEDVLSQCNVVVGYYKEWQTSKTQDNVIYLADVG